MNIKELAEQAGFDKHHAEHDTRIKRFAELVAAAEREACAKLCRKNAHLTTGLHHAAAIRARGKST